MANGWLEHVNLTVSDDGPGFDQTIFDRLGDMQATFTKLETLRIPVIAAIQGGCIGGAVDMVSACCIRYATAQAFFCIQEINIGMMADVGVLQRLPKIIPQAVAREMAYTGERMPAERALANGTISSAAKPRRSTSSSPAAPRRTGFDHRRRRTR